MPLTLFSLLLAVRGRTRVIPSLVALGLPLSLAACGPPPDCSYYQTVTFETEILQSSQTIESTQADLNLYHEIWSSNSGAVILELPSGPALTVYRVLDHAVREDVDVVDPVRASISVYDADRTACRISTIQQFEVALEDRNVFGNVYDDRVDPEFQSTFVLHLRIDDPEFISSCALDRPFEVRLRLTTDASMVEEVMRTPVHRCKEG